MTPDVSVLVVNHRSAGEAASCVVSVREAFERERIAGEIVLVDCGSGAEEVARLAALSADVFLSLSENRGYAGGLNAGLARSRGRLLLLCNADVVLLPGALRALAAAAGQPSVGVAAPLAFWDEGLGLRLPAGDAPRLVPALARLAGIASPALDLRRFAAYARETVRLWTAGGKTRHLVGAVLAARREVFDRVGRLDERFPFEYEETEWEDRVRRSGLELRFVPEARIRHRWAASAERNPESAERRAASRRLYREMRWGRAARRALERADALPQALPEARSVAEPEAPARAGAWIALSTNPSLIPFAGAPLDRAFRLPDDVRRRLPPATWYLRAFRATDGRTLETLRWDKKA
ncbi:MAG TPA: glycosyltransferase [Thermoanaerobaculia bacterium]